MRRPHALATILLTFLSFSSAQLLTNGNSQLPSCASSCQLLNQAAEACGGTTSASQSIWSCFCQSGYLKSLYDSDTGICDSTCTSASDSQQVSTWYKSNCGTDNGASEHADSSASTTAATSTATSASTSAGVVATIAASTGTSSSGVTADTSDNSGSDGSWWSTHYRWVIMLIVLAIGLSLLAVLAVYLKRRHDRKADQIRHGFNAGITTRRAPTRPSRKGVDGVGDSTMLSETQMTGAGGFESGSGRNSPARTRDAFMPYGYGYTRSESRLASRTELDARRSPLARGGTHVRDMEKEVGGGASPESQIRPNSMQGKQKKKVLVRERSMLGPESPDIEKSIG